MTGEVPDVAKAAADGGGGAEVWEDIYVCSISWLKKRANVEHKHGCLTVNFVHQKKCGKKRLFFCLDLFPSSVIYLPLKMLAFVFASMYHDFSYRSLTFVTSGR